MSERNLIYENFHTKHSAFTAPDVHMHTSLSKPVNKAAEHLINSKPVLGRRKKMVVRESGPK